MAYWLTEANNVYNRIRTFYGSQSTANLPTDETGVFKGYAGVTKMVCLVTINAMRENWDLGWFTGDNVTRAAAFSEIAADVWTNSGFTASIPGIITFENWVFVATKANANLQRYFAGGEYGQLTNISDALTNAVSTVTNTAVDIVKTVVTVPSESAGLVAKWAPAVKWAAIIWGASKVLKAFKKA